MPPEQTLLAIDTTAAFCAVALLCGDEILAQQVEPMTRGQVERLFPLIQEVLAEAGKTIDDLGALAVNTGPGNFTGIRIGVSATRGLAMGLGIPAIGISAPDTPIDRLARMASAQLATGEPTERPAPAYLRPANAAPSRTPPVVILDDT